MVYQRNQVSRIHRGTNSTESQESICGTSPKTYDPNENTLILRGAGIFQNLLGIKSLYDRGRRFFHVLAGEVISAKLSAGKATGAHVTWAFRQGVIQNSVKHLRWSTLCKELMAKSCLLFLQKAPSQFFDRVLSTLLHVISIFPFSYFSACIFYSFHASDLLF